MSVWLVIQDRITDLPEWLQVQLCSVQSGYKCSCVQFRVATSAVVFSSEWLQVQLCSVQKPIMSSDVVANCTMHYKSDF